MNNRNLTIGLVVLIVLLGAGLAYMAATRPALEPAQDEPSTTQNPVVTPDTEDTTPEEEDTEDTEDTTADSDSTLEKRGINVLTAFREQDVAELATMIHPTKGVRFSPSGYVNLESDQLFTPARFEDWFNRDEKLLWGYHDASGMALEYTVKEYLKAYVYDEDFLNALEVYVNEFTNKGLNQNNMKEIYPKASFIEYHFPGFEESAEGMDWKSLRLALEEVDGRWYLVGVAHDWHSI